MPPSESQQEGADAGTALANGVDAGTHKIVSPPISDNALKIMERRYLLKTHDGVLLETPAQMWRRVAHAIASVDDRLYNKPSAFVAAFEEDLHREMAMHRFIPAGRTLANAGGPTRVVQNCVVLGIDDSLDSIFRTLHDAVLLQQSGCGLGFALHTMRPAGATARTTYGSSSGPVSFLGVYSAAFSIVKQQNRSGANMAVCRCVASSCFALTCCTARWLH